MGRRRRGASAVCAGAWPYAAAMQPLCCPSVSRPCSSERSRAADSSTRSPPPRRPRSPALRLHSRTPLHPRCRDQREGEGLTKPPMPAPTMPRDKDWARGARGKRAAAMSAEAMQRRAQVQRLAVRLVVRASSARDGGLPAVLASSSSPPAHGCAPAGSARNLGSAFSLRHLQSYIPCSSQKTALLGCVAAHSENARPPRSFVVRGLVDSDGSSAEVNAQKAHDGARAATAPRACGARCSAPSNSAERLPER